MNLPQTAKILKPDCNICSDYYDLSGFHGGMGLYPIPP